MDCDTPWEADSYSDAYNILSFFWVRRFITLDFSLQH